MFLEEEGRDFCRFVSNLDKRRIRYLSSMWLLFILLLLPAQAYAQQLPMDFLNPNAYATYNGLPALPDSALYASWGQPAWHGSNTSGESDLPVQQAIYRLQGVADPVHVFSRGDTVLRIGIAYPAIPDVPALLKALGEPALKLDYHFDVAIMQGLRWAYPARGIALDLNDDHSVVIGICLFVPTTAAAYRAEIHTSKPIREFPLSED